MENFISEKFVEVQIEKLREAIGDERALVAVSGGVDSTTCAVLTHKAIGENLVCVILDDAFMREGEPEYVAKILSNPPFSVPTQVIDVRERFLRVMKGLKDAEEKRRKFRETFYQVLAETAKKEQCDILVQGTIRADVEETVGGVKTQHNVLEQMGINPMEHFGFQVVEPLVTLYKEQVRMVARSLGLPSEFSERQPFPGPGLSVRVVGEIRPDKLDTVKKSTTIVERELAPHNPSQYFAAIIDNQKSGSQSKLINCKEVVSNFLDIPLQNIRIKKFRDKATGVTQGERRYGRILGINVQIPKEETRRVPFPKLFSLHEKIISQDPEVTRVLYSIREISEKKPYVITIRSVQTKNFLTAEVSKIPWSTLSRVVEEIIEECPKVSTVYYDVTPKPPATIEME